MSPSTARINEVDFCSQIASEANVTFRQNPDGFPFVEARVEGYGAGAGAGRSKRKDLRFYGHDGKLLLCGEVKLPGTPEGRSAVGESLMADAAAKADNAGVQFFFTWNVNEFVLWDRSRFDLPLIDRRVNFWRLGRTLASPQEVAREDNLAFIKTDFLPGLLHDLAEIISGRLVDWSLPPDDIFIRSLESHLDWPVFLASAYILEHARTSKQFRSHVLEWMHEQDWTVTETPAEQWAKALDNMAKTVAYVWSNRLIFYKALRDRFTELPQLELRRSVKTATQAVRALNRFFELAVERSGDYEPLLMPKATDWATELIFQPANALDAWRGVLKGINAVDFHKIPADVVGRIFQKLIGPEERHRYGQHFTGDDPVDLINSFCVHGAADAVLDPACGSASFLVRAYYRKRHLDAGRPHLDLLTELFGCDIAMYPAHLATLNLAAREINEEANYPRIARMNFFDFDPEKPFCTIPDETGTDQPIVLPPLDAVVGNPPYVRQEKVDPKDKARFSQIARDAWPELRLTKRSDLHCYFWPAAARLLKPDGYFGFLTSSSWLDVEYGFALQGWVLSRFRLLAILESAAEPWFEDARVKTCITILRRCDDAESRMSNLVRFVRFDRKLADIIGIAAGENEDSRQEAIERLRERILNVRADFQDGDMRIIVKAQKDLWEDGLRAGVVLRGSGDNDDSDEPASDEDGGPSAPSATSQSQMFGRGRAEYAAGKWGRYVRAPDFYFDIMRRFGRRFVPLGEIAEIRFGVKSGCDAFFMPTDISLKALKLHRGDRAFRRAYGGAPRIAVASRKLKIVKAGDKSVHPVESRYLAPEVHSLMKVKRPVIRNADVNRVVLLVGERMEELKHDAPWTWRYLRYGMTPVKVMKRNNQSYPGWRIPPDPKGDPLAHMFSAGNGP